MTEDSGPSILRIKSHGNLSASPLDIDGVRDWLEGNYGKVRDIRQVPIPDLDESEGRERAVQLVTNALLATLATPNLAVIDLRIGRFQRDAIFESLFAECWSVASTELAIEFPRVLVLVDEIPDDHRLQITEPLLPRIQAGHVTAIAEDGSVLGETQDLPADTVTVTCPSLDDHRDLLAKAFLRRRGVFYSHQRENGELLGFLYSSEACPDSMRFCLSSYLRGVSSERTKPVVVYDAPISAWLREPLEDEGLTQGLPIYSLGDLHDPESDFAAAALGDLAAADLVVVIVAIAKSGNSLTRTLDRVGELSAAHVRCLAVGLDPDLGSEGTLMRRMGTDYVELPVGAGGIQRVDFFLSVKQEVLDSSNWLRTAAEQSQTIEDPLDGWLTPSPLGMWSLFEELGIGDEPDELVPDYREPLCYFPQMQNLGADDALWLAESLVRLCVEWLETPREKLMFVLPDEESGSRQLGQALEGSLRIRSVRVPRSEFGSLSRDISPGDFAGRRIVVADESSISYRTLTDLESWVSRNAARPADLLASLIDFGDPTRPNTFAAVYRYPSMSTGS